MKKRMQCNFLVGGAGIAGICAAVQAGRLSLKTILVEKEMLLGGNGGPNLGVGLLGSMKCNPYWNETGIVEELEERVNYFRARIFPCHETYNIDPTWDYVVSKMLEEAGVTVLRRHLVTNVEMEGSSIKKVNILNIENLDEITVEIDGFVYDSTGDAHIAAKAGAETVIGRESKLQTGERSAPEKEDGTISASSVIALTVDSGIDSPFTPPLGTPKWNPDKPANTFNPKDNINFLFQVDEGGESAENHALFSPQDLYLNLVKRIYSIWDYFKNTLYPEDARTHKLVWISPILGRRESRRIVGDYMLTQTDIESCRVFTDAVGFGGFYLDEHPPSFDGGYETRFYSRPIPYDIPFRSIYSRNIENLFSGGRCIGTTHLAFTTARVMRTGGLLGQAAAVAANECIEREISPRELYEKHTKELQQSILKQDGWIIGIKNCDNSDLARGARVKASSQAALNREPQGNRWLKATDGIGVAVYCYPDKLHKAAFYIRNKPSNDKELEISIGYGETPQMKFPEIKDRDSHSYQFHYPERQDNITDFDIYINQTLNVPSEFEGWFNMECDNELSFPVYKRGVFVQAVLVSIKGDVEVLCAPHEVDVVEGVKCIGNGWETVNDNVPFFRVTPDPVPGKAENILDGHIHREGMAHLHQWMSKPGQSMPQWIELDLIEEKKLNKILLRFDVTEKYWKDMYHLRGERAAGRCAADYRIEFEENGEWKTIVEQRDNYRRFREHRLQNTITTRKVRLTVERVWGENQSARVYEIRLYNE